MAFDRDYDMEYDWRLRQNRLANWNQGYYSPGYSNPRGTQGRFSRGWSPYDPGASNYPENLGYYNSPSYSRDLGEMGLGNEPTWTYTEFWFIPGPYTGYGPKGYERSDDRIRDDISDRLFINGQIDASDIDLDVKNGEVSLKGNVNSRREKRIAEDIADSVPGVKDVHNQLTVRQSSGQPSMQRQPAGKGMGK